MLKEFREFAMKGNMLDLAIGVVIGAAFGAIVNSLVADIFTPLLGLATGGIDFKEAKYVLKAAVGEAPEVAIRYGVFINTIINFIIVAFCMFMVVKTMNRLRRQKEEAPTPPDPTVEEKLLTEIRDILKSGGKAVVTAPATETEKV